MRMDMDVTKHKIIFVVVVCEHHAFPNRLNDFPQALEEKVEHWMEKCDRDVEAKQHELDVLKVYTVQIPILTCIFVIYRECCFLLRRTIFPLRSENRDVFCVANGIEVTVALFCPGGKYENRK